VTGPLVEAGSVMQSILSHQGAEVLLSFASDRGLLAFDFDGTLAPLVEDRNATAMRNETRRLLRMVALLYPCAVISGRAREDVTRRLESVPLVGVVGNLGAEAGSGPLERSLREAVAQWGERLRRRLADVEGIEVEEKGFSLALHYRQATRQQDTKDRILVAVDELEGAVAFEGHGVVNVAPARAPTKGDALEALCRRLAVNLAAFVGDDVTDEEAFRSPVVRVGIRVGEAPDSAAQYFVTDQREVDALLRALIVARLRADGYKGSSEGVLRALKS